MEVGVTGGGSLVYLGESVMSPVVGPDQGLRVSGLRVHRVVESFVLLHGDRSVCQAPVKDLPSRRVVAIASATADQREKGPDHQSHYEHPTEGHQHPFPRAPMSRICQYASDHAPSMSGLRGPHRDRGTSPRSVRAAGNPAVNARDG